MNKTIQREHVKGPGYHPGVSGRKRGLKESDSDGVNRQTLSEQGWVGYSLVRSQSPRYHLNL